MPPTDYKAGSVVIVREFHFEILNAPSLSSSGAYFRCNKNDVFDLAIMDGHTTFDIVRRRALDGLDKEKNTR